MGKANVSFVAQEKVHLRASRVRSGWQPGATYSRGFVVRVVVQHLNSKSAGRSPGKSTEVNRLSFLRRYAYQRPSWLANTQPKSVRLSGAQRLKTGPRLHETQTESKHINKQTGCFAQKNLPNRIRCFTLCSTPDRSRYHRRRKGSRSLSSVD